MAERTSVPKEFEEFLKSCPELDEIRDEIVVTGQVARTKSAETFALIGADGTQTEVPRSAVRGFQTTAGTGAAGMAELRLSRSALGADLAARLKLPIEKPIITDTIKESPADTLKESPADTLKELPGDGTFKEMPFDTLKEIGGGDTLKEGPFDTLKEVGGADTLKETPFDTLKEGPGDGTGIADTLVEGVGQPGGEVVNPALRAGVGPAGLSPGLSAGLAGTAGLKPAMTDTLKEAMIDQTLKEVINDPKFIKEAVKEVVKEVAFEGTGAMDTLVEGRPDFGGMTLVEGRPDLGGILTNPALGGTPFVLATPHQASMGAVAQQMLAAQAMAGRLGF